MIHPGPLFDDWPFKGLEPGSFDLLMVDPPWDFSTFSEKGGNKSAQKHYKCLPTAEIMKFPVMDLASSDSLIWLWATNPMLPDAFEVMKAWGFKYATAGSWTKTTVNNKVSFGTGYILRGSNEPFLIGTRGKPKTTKSTRSVIHGKIRGHSVKPEEAYEAAEKLMPKARYIEIFSRTDRKNWSTWGDEKGKFGESNNGE